jgi:hypothetical protein
MTFELTPVELQIVLNGLGELPLKVGIDLAVRLKNEFESQIKESGAEEAEVV